MFYFLLYKLSLKIKHQVSIKLFFYLATLCYFISIYLYKSYYYSLLIPIDLIYSAILIAQKYQLISLGQANPTLIQGSNQEKQCHGGEGKGQGEGEREGEGGEGGGHLFKKVKITSVSNISPNPSIKIISAGDKQSKSKHHILKNLEKLRQCKQEQKDNAIKYRPHKIELYSPLQQTIKNLGIS